MLEGNRWQAAQLILHDSLGGDYHSEPMTSESRLEELLLKWEDERRRGRRPSAVDLCAKCPELAEELERRIKALEAYETVCASTNVDNLRPASDAPAPRAPDSGGDLKPGISPLPGYRLVKRLGRGGFGEVWEAMAPGDFRVALKFVTLDEERSQVEVAALDIVRALRHPNLLTTFGAWKQDAYLIIAMELADRTLLDRFREAVSQGELGIPRDELLEYFREAAAGIDYLNDARHTVGSKENVGIQHRDIKPQNILLVGSGVKVADFGLVRFLEHAVTGHTGNLTPMYAAPEFFNGQTTRSSDQYCLAITYCQLRGGRIPFGTSHAELIAGHVSGTPNLSMLPPEERDVVARALAKTPDQRWPSCRDFVRALAECKAPATPAEPRPKRSAAPFAIAACLLLATAFTVWKWPSLPKNDPQAHVPDALTQLAPKPVEGPALAAPPKSAVKKPLIETPAVKPQPVRPELINVPPAAAVALQLIVPSEMTLMWGESGSLPIRVERSGGDGVVRITAKSVPAHVEIKTADVPMALSQRDLEVVAGLEAEEGKNDIVLEATLGAVTAHARFRLTISRPTGAVRTLTGHKGPVRTAVFVPGGGRVASAGDDGDLVVWDLQSSQEILRIHCHAARITGLAVTDDGKRAVTSSHDRSLRVWDLDTGKELSRFAKHADDVECVALNGEQALSGDKKANIWLWDIATGKEIRAFEGANESIWSLAFAAGGRAYSAGNSKFIRVWDVLKGTEIEAIDIGFDDVRCISFARGAPDALVAGGESQGRSAVQIRKLQTKSSPSGFGGYRALVAGVAASKSGQWVLSAGSDGLARLWDVTELKEVISFSHPSAVYWVAFSPSERAVLSSCHDGAIRLWALK
jgi:WD40 repeat protein/serine/threonine protein kinase